MNLWGMVVSTKFITVVLAIGCFTYIISGLNFTIIDRHFIEILGFYAAAIKLYNDARLSETKEIPK